MPTRYRRLQCSPTLCVGEIKKAIDVSCRCRATLWWRQLQSPAAQRGERDVALLASAVGFWMALRGSDLRQRAQLYRTHDGQRAGGAGAYPTPRPRTAHLCEI
ncbi:unspecified product [Leishmania tarentolae]|uniref:Unspecified product n=1 Tax=Leishmania tarentolae TaxID=5689 RepID=A0A640KGR9_LEITA|nr:unspecified product [Leishmania tarentolae]